MTWFECPLAETPANYAAIKRLRAKANAAGMRLAGAELFIGAAGFKPLLEQGLYDVVMPDVKYAGGLAECLRIAELAARHGTAVSLHNPSGPVCHAHSVHLSAALEGSERLEYQHGETPAILRDRAGARSAGRGKRGAARAVRHQGRLCMRLAFVSLLFLCSIAAAQTFPSKPIRVIVPSPPGDGSDVVARLIGEKLTAAWGQQIVVDNRTGAGGRIGTEAASKAAPDGYTWIMANAGSHGINGGLYRNLPYDLEKDFAPITQIMRAPNALVVSPSLGVASVAELIALLKKNPGKYSYGSGGNGSSAHLSAELFKSMAGVDIVHIPYKGATLALTDLIAGNVVMFMGNLPPSMGHIKAGRIKALAVTTLARSKFVPELPTVDESGLKGFETVAWFGLLAPAGTPAAVISKTRDEVARILQTEELRARIDSLGGEPVGNTPQEFAAIIRADIAKWRRVVDQAGIKVD